jgi:hypothetical protein
VEIGVIGAHQGGGPGQDGLQEAGRFQTADQVQRGLVECGELFLLSLELGLAADPLGDINHLGDEVQRLPVGGGHHRSGQVRPHLGAVGAEIALLDLVPVLAPGHGVLFERLLGLPVVGMCDVSPVRGQHLGLGSSQDLAEGRIHLEEPALQVAQGHADRSGLEGDAETSFGLLERAAILGLDDPAHVLPYRSNSPSTFRLLLRRARSGPAPAGVSFGRGAGDPA